MNVKNLKETAQELNRKLNAQSAERYAAADVLITAGALFAAVGQTVRRMRPAVHAAGRALHRWKQARG